MLRNRQAARTWLLLTLALIAAAFGLVDLLAVARGTGFFVMPLLGLGLGWCLRQTGGPRLASTVALGANGLVLLVFLAATLILGGS